MLFNYFSFLNNEFHKLTQIMKICVNILQLFKQTGMISPKQYFSTNSGADSVILDYSKPDTS
jgi:hypothetical protein